MAPISLFFGLSCCYFQSKSHSEVCLLHVGCCKILHIRRKRAVVGHVETPCMFMYRSVYMVEMGILVVVVAEG